MSEQKLPNASKGLSSYEQLRELYLQSGLTQAELSEITGIKKGTLEFWLSGYRKTPIYAVEFIRHKLEQHFKRNVNNGDVIRDMSNEEINVLLSDIKVDAQNAEWNIEKMKPEYRDFGKFLSDIQLIKPYNQKPSCKKEDDEYSGLSDREKIRKIYEYSGLSYTQFSKLTGISRTTISNWLSHSNNSNGASTEKISPHASYIVEYLKYKVDEYKKECECNGDVIREMNNEKLADFLSNFRDAFLEAKGNKEDLPSKYRQIECFAEGTHLVRPRFITDNNKLLERK